MGKLHSQDYQMRFKRGLAANVDATATVNQALEGEPAWATDTQQMYVFNGTAFVPVGGSLPYVEKTANYTFTDADYTVNYTSGTANATLLTAVGRAGKIFQLNNSGTGIITVLTTSSQTINGDASGTITLSQWEQLTFQSNGANWILIH